MSAERRGAPRSREADRQTASRSGGSGRGCLRGEARSEAEETMRLSGQPLPGPSGGERPSAFLKRGRKFCRASLTAGPEPAPGAHFPRRPHKGRLRPRCPGRPARSCPGRPSSAVRRGAAGESGRIQPPEWACRLASPRSIARTREKIAEGESKKSRKPVGPSACPPEQRCCGAAPGTCSRPQPVPNTSSVSAGNFCALGSSRGIHLFPLLRQPHGARKCGGRGGGAAREESGLGSAVGRAGARGPPAPRGPARQPRCAGARGARQPRPRRAALRSLSGGRNGERPALASFPLNSSRAVGAGGGRRACDRRRCPQLPRKALPYPRALPPLAPARPGLGARGDRRGSAAGAPGPSERLPQAALPGSDPQPEYFAQFFAPRLSQGQSQGAQPGPGPGPSPGPGPGTGPPSGESRSVEPAGGGTRGTPPHTSDKERPAESPAESSPCSAEAEPGWGAAEAWAQRRGAGGSLWGFRSWFNRPHGGHRSVSRGAPSCSPVLSVPSKTRHPPAQAQPQRRLPSSLLAAGSGGGSSAFLIYRAAPGRQPGNVPSRGFFCRAPSYAPAALHF
ncbi:collagen alpha-1(I) chain-like [Corvus cornix cornix]|uniref:collagen alpha-1(I) chain-like n=1 Tax=Corvus cornix cornix TaxID=932674 RepID=UPI0019501A13|nr:collagen alpha-1(I) chain-like [Corvus cornix cornix]